MTSKESHTPSFFERLVTHHFSIIIVIAFALVVGAVTYGITRSFVLTSSSDFVVDDENTRVLFDGACVDSDDGAEERGIYKPGTALIVGQEDFAIEDRCTSHTQLREAYCLEDPPRSEEYIPSTFSADCMFGCSEGVCNKEYSPEGGVKRVSFSPPYSLTWRDNNVRYSVTQVSLGDIPAPVDLRDFSGGEYTYDTGEIIHALVFALNIDVVGAPECVHMNMRRLINEYGDMVVPNTQAFEFPDSTGCVPKNGASYDDVLVMFVVNEGDTSFLVSSGEESGIFFSIEELGDTLRVLNVTDGRG